MNALSVEVVANAHPVQPLSAVIDRGEWALSLSAVSYGVPFGVRVSDPDVAQALSRHLPPGCKRHAFNNRGRVYSLVTNDTHGPRRIRNALYVDGIELARRPTVQGLLHAFEAAVQLHVAEMAEDRVFVHAGVVGWQGRAILLPGRSFSGKTTLVTELVRAGAEYYSDEYAVLDPSGVVHPYARALSIRRPGVPGGRKYLAGALGAHTGSEPLSVGLVVSCKFRRGATWRPLLLSPGNGALTLLENTVPARRIPEVVLPTLQKIVSVAPVVSSERGEANAVVSAILRLVASR